MSRLRRIGDLEIEQDLGYQRRVWRYQRIVQAIMLAAVLAGLAGLLGPGPLSERVEGEGTPLRVEYSRFAHNNAPTQLRIHAGPSALRDGKLRISINQDYARCMQLKTVTPQPEASRLEEGRMVLEFDARAGSGGTVNIELEPESAGLHRARIGLEGRETVAFNQWVYP